jgi:hypothetical protein
MTNKDRLTQLIDEVPEGMAAEILDFAERLRAKGEPEGLTAEDRAWLDADLSRMGELEPYDWGGTDPLAGEKLTWDAKTGSFRFDAATYALTLRDGLVRIAG